MDKPGNAQRLVPARPHARDDANAAYLPRLPWRLIALGTLSVLVIIGGYLWKEQRKAAELRAQILRVHQTELAPARDAYVAFLDKLERMIGEAASAPLENFVDRRLHLPGLRAGNGLYLRLPLAAAHDKAQIASAAKSMEPDLIATCLGLAPASARGLYERGEFLLPEFLGDAEHQSSVMRLRVTDEMLSRHIRADLPSVLGLLRSDWFMLVLQEGENRRDAPVRVALWDLQRGALLLRARVQSRGILLTSHILSQGTHPNTAPPAGEHSSGAANDCSIASELKQLTAAP